MRAGWVKPLVIRNEIQQPQTIGGELEECESVIKLQDGGSIRCPVHRRPIAFSSLFAYIPNIMLLVCRLLYRRAWVQNKQFKNGKFISGIPNVME